MNYSQTFALLLCLGYITLSQAKPTGLINPTFSKTAHQSVKKSSVHHHTRNRYHGKSHKRHLRKKKQYIMAGLAGSLTGYGMAGIPGMAGMAGMPGYSAFSMTNPQSYGYAPTQSVDPTYGLAALGGGTQPSLMGGSLQDPNSALLQSRQSLLSSYTGAADQGLPSYNNNGFGSYANGGLQDASSLQNSLAGYDQNGLSSSLSNTMTGGLGNAYSNTGLGNAFSNGVNSYAGNGANQITSLNGLTPLGSTANQASSFMGNSANNKYAAESLSAGLDTPNGIANIANLLNSAQTSFDSDTQGQLVNNNLDMNKFAQRFGNQPTASQSNLGIPGLTQPSSPAAAEAQSFENQLSHLSNEKLKLGGNIRANYANYGDSIDTNNLNEIGQIASTGISDSNLQKLLGQLMSGQFAGHGHNMAGPGQPSAGLGMPSENSAGTYDSGGMGSQQLEDQAGFSGPLIAPVIHGQTIRVHASDKPRYHLVDKEGHASASKTAINVQRQASQEHKIKLEQLKEKLKMLRQKLRKLKQEYNDDYYDDESDSDNDMTSDLTEKSETQTLDDLKIATEEALKELKREMAKVKAKGKKVIFIHKFSPQSTSNVSGKKKGQTIGELETEMLELIDDDHRILANELNKRKHPANNHVSLTELDKQAEQEVNYLTSKNPKVVKKKHHRRIHNHQPIEGGDSHSQGKKPFLQDDLDDNYRPSKHKPSEGETSNSIKANHLAEDLGGIEKLLHKNHPDPASNKTARVKHSLGFFSIGCWRDQPERALMSLEGIFPILDGNDYMRRKYAIRKCAQVARVQGFSGFAIENGGHCLGDKNVLQTYSMYGPSKGCKTDGKGGPWSMEVYKFTTSTTQPKTRRGDILRAIGPEYIFYKGTNGQRKNEG